MWGETFAILQRRPGFPEPPQAAPPIRATGACGMRRSPDERLLGRDTRDGLSRNSLRSCGLRRYGAPDETAADDVNRLHVAVDSERRA